MSFNFFFKLDLIALSSFSIIKLTIKPIEDQVILNVDFKTL